ncbi:MAG: hypothetical protein VX681_11800 [Myxococcota bacterium]|nr:hypothetical protein [Myxococcota bacterium]
MTRVSLGRAAALGLAALLIALAADAFIPRAERVVRAVAERNKDAGRAQPLRLDLVLRIEESDPIGTGILVTHPSGLARLELRGPSGVVERHVLQGGEHLAMRDGERLREPRAFLPPLFLLQADHELELRSGLAQLGAELDSIGLARCDEDDCYVIGDPTRAPPPFEPPIPESEALEFEALELDTLELDTTALFEPIAPEGIGEPLAIDGPRATIWVDVLTFEPRRIELQSGVRIWFGAPAAFDQVQVPSWIRIDEPGKRPVTFDVVAVSPVDAPAAAFSLSWLQRPIQPVSPPAKTVPGPLSGENP